MEKPVIFAVCGFEAEADELSLLSERAPGCEVDVRHLTKQGDVEDFAAHFDQVIRDEYAGRRVLLLGLSVGGLAVLAMSEGQAVVAVDPPLSTAGLWPLRDRLRQEVKRRMNPAFSAMVWRLFGVGEIVTENRDYRYLIAAAARPTLVLVAGDPLEPERDANRFPGLISRDDRAFLARARTVTTQTVEGVGHSIATQAPQALMDALKWGVAALGYQTA